MIEGRTIQSAHAILGERDSGGFGPGELFMNFTDGAQLHIYIEDGVIASRILNDTKAPADAAV
jgi:hypothetical protein